MPDDKKFIHLGYDVTLAITSAKVLGIETTSAAECFEQVYGPTQTLLQEYVGQHPKQLTCLHGAPYSYYGFQGFSADVYMVARGNKIIHLCAVLTSDQMRSLRNWFLRTLPESSAKLRDAPNIMITERSGRKVPVLSKTLDESALAEGIKRYMQIFAPQLSSLPVVWLPEQTQGKILNFVWSMAQRTAKKQTAKERERIIRLDTP